MKRVVISIIAALAIFAIGNAAGAHAGEVFNEDVTITDAVIQANEYEQAVFKGNLNIDCTVIGQQSFKEAIILGEVTINAKIISQEAFKNAVIKGKLTINDDASIDETAFVNEIADKIIYGSLTIDEKSYARAYNDYIILGDVTIKRSSLLYGGFAGAKILGNLTVERTAMGEWSFSRATIMGDVSIDRALLSQYSFNYATILGNLEVKRALAYQQAFYEIQVDGTENIDESSQFFNTYSHFSSRAVSNDISYTDTILRTIDEEVMLGDIVLENSILEDYAFYSSSSILGDIILKNSVIYPNSSRYARMVGEIIADEASVLTENLPSEPSHAGEQFEGDVLITDPVVFSEQYKGASFLGDLTVESRFIDKNAFENVIVVGNLTIRSEKISAEAFKNGVVGGRLLIEEPTEIIGTAAFYGMKPTAKSVSLPSSLIIIGDQAFMNIGLTDIGIVYCHKLKSIGTQAFYGCNLTSLIFPLTDNALTIGAEAFWTSKTTGPRDVYLPHHKSNLRYGYPISNSISQKIEDFMNADDNIYLWLDLDNMEECLPIVYGNWQLYERNYGSYDDWYYSLTPGSNTYGSGALYIPKGTKLLLHKLLYSKIEQYYDYDNPHASTIFLYPFYLYIPIDNWIEIDMGEYPGAGILYRGDLNGDAQTDATDVAILLEMVLAGGVTDAQKAVADLNDDGDVDAVDLSILIEMVLSGE